MQLDMKKFEEELGVEPLDRAEAVKVTEASAALTAPTIADPSDVYKEYAELVKVGKSVLQQVSYMMNAAPADGETIASVASVMTSIKDVLKEFSKLHTDQLKHQRGVEMENLKQANREKLAQLKYDLALKEGAVETQGIPFNQETAMALVEKALKEPKDL